MLDFHKRNIYRVNSNVINKGNGFSSLIFIANVSDPSIKVNIKLNQSTSKPVVNHGWVGIVEYVELITGKENIVEALTSIRNIAWGVDLVISFDDTGVDDDEAEEDVSSFISCAEDGLREVIIYEWDLESLAMLYLDSEDGSSIMNGLHSMWLQYFSKYLKSKDVNLVNDSRYGRVGSIILNGKIILVKIFLESDYGLDKHNYSINISK